MDFLTKSAFIKPIYLSHQAQQASTIQMSRSGQLQRHCQWFLTLWTMLKVASEWLLIKAYSLYSVTWCLIKSKIPIYNNVMTEHTSSSLAAIQGYKNSGHPLWPEGTLTSSCCHLPRLLRSMPLRLLKPWRKFLLWRLGDYSWKIIQINITITS